jgi:PncC family amidohydrolase
VATDPLVDLAERLQGRCLGRRITVATAESCTGGLISHLLTEIPGASGYLVGGVVAYANDTKRRLLDVPGDVIEAHGAVSAQVAVAMAEGIRARLGSDLAVAVTGILGPGGGTDAKPVGLAYVAVAGLGAPGVRRFNWTGDRASNKREAARAAFELLLERVDEPPDAPAPGGRV